MSNDRFQRAKEVFTEVKDLSGSDASERLEHLCEGDEHLRLEVEALLAQHDSCTALFPRAAHAVCSEPPDLDDRFRIVRVLGEGGFGIVYLAEQVRPIRREVAVKVLKPGLVSEGIIARFKAERQALALMDHPNVAKVLDAGMTASGRAYFIMEFVDGEQITTFCAKARSSVRERLELFVEVCEGIQHAHGKGVIHRDIKPANVLVTTTTGRSIPKLIDFGVAKAMHESLSDRTIVTGEGHLLGTLAYMSPEQASGGIDIDTRSDVYSLGVLLFELLTGTTPFTPQERTPAALFALRAEILERAAVKPSRRAASSQETNGEQRSLSRTLRGDLDWIVLRCLEKDRDRRYESAGQLAEDVRRHLSDLPVVAGPPSAAYRVRKFVRRNRALAFAGTIAVAALVIGSGAATVFALGERDANRSLSSALGLANERQRQLIQIASLPGDLLRDAQLEDLGQELVDGVRNHTNPSDVAAFVISEHLIRAALEEVDSDAYDPFVRASVKESLAAKYRELGRYEEAVQLQRSVIEDFRVACETDPELRSSHFNAYIVLARFLTPLGRIDEAEDALLLAAEHFESRGDRGTYALAIGNLASVVSRQGRMDEAEALMLESIAIHEAVYGPTDDGVIAGLTELGRMYLSARRLPDARATMERALKIIDRESAGEHDVLRNLLNNYGMSFGLEGQFETALPIHARALEVHRRQLGDVNPETVQAWQNYAFVLARTGRYEQAEREYRSALALCRKVVSDDNAWTQWRLQSEMAETIAKQGRFKEAEPLLIEAAERIDPPAPEQRRRRQAIQRVVSLYNEWDAASPDEGHAEQAEHWSAVLESATREAE